MKDIKHIHRQAMEHSDLALLERRKGDEGAAMRHVRSAYELEAKAAKALVNDLTAEPARSVLFRSAATLARECGLFADAEKLIREELAGAPPTAIADELHELLEQKQLYVPALNFPTAGSRPAACLISEKPERSAQRPGGNAPAAHRLTLISARRGDTNAMSHAPAPASPRSDRAAAGSIQPTDCQQSGYPTPPSSPDCAEPP